MDNPQAFPLNIENVPEGDCSKRYFYAGMTLRDYFAGQALIGLAHCNNCRDELNLWAKDAYAYADAMLSERGKNEKE